MSASQIAKIIRLQTPTLVAFILLLGSTSCTLLNPLTESNYHRSSPPNHAAISDNFYCDKTEIRNVDWREYMYWTARVFGSDSEEYHATIPDSAALMEFVPCFNDFSNPGIDYYLRHPTFDNYPVIGVSQAQAMAYSQWRSDRVMEFTLTRLNRITPIETLTADNYFTIERYFRGQLPNIIPGNHQPVLYYPEFRLPSREERQQILRFADDQDRAYFQKCRSGKCLGCREDFPVFRSDVPPCDGSNNLPLSPCDEGCAAVFFHLRGNVNEWLAEPNMAAGGGWKDSREAILKQDTFFFETPNSRTGFRNVCQWKQWKE